MTDLQKWYSEHGICYTCGQRKAVRGRKRCPSCAEDSSNAYKAWYADHSEEVKADMKVRCHNRYQDRKGRGVCVRCERPANLGNVYCKQCLIRKSNENRKYNEAKGKMPRYMFGDWEHCEMCGKPVDNVKLCSVCYEKALKNIAKANAAKKGGWKDNKWLFTPKGT